MNPYDDYSDNESSSSEGSDCDDSTLELKQRLAEMINMLETGTKNKKRNKLKKGKGKEKGGGAPGKKDSKQTRQKKPSKKEREAQSKRDREKNKQQKRQGQNRMSKEERFEKKKHDLMMEQLALDKQEISHHKSTTIKSEEDFVQDQSESHAKELHEKLVKLQKLVRAYYDEMQKYKTVRPVVIPVRGLDKRINALNAMLTALDEKDQGKAEQAKATFLTHYWYYQLFSDAYQALKKIRSSTFLPTFVEEHKIGTRELLFDDDDGNFARFKIHVDATIKSDVYDKNKSAPKDIKNVFEAVLEKVKECKAPNDYEKVREALISLMADHVDADEHDQRSRRGQFKEQNELNGIDESMEEIDQTIKQLTAKKTKLQTRKSELVAHEGTKGSSTKTQTNEVDALMSQLQAEISGTASRSGLGISRMRL